jgi:Common central domain of tyrosinase/Polyphenol oxidase middle domain
MIVRANGYLLAALAVLAPLASAQHVEIPGVGWEGQGADIVLLQLDGDARPDLIAVAYDNPARGNTFRYRVGLNLDAAGVSANWTSGYIEVPGVGWEGQGAGAAAADLDGNGQPELLLMAYDNPGGENSFRYTIGWNLDAQGRAANWSTHAQVRGVGWEGQGAAVVIGQIDTNPRPDFLFIAYDNPAQANSFRYRLGLNADAQGNATWAANFVEVPGVGWEGQGLGAALAGLDANARPDLLLLSYDNPSGPNTFRYRTGLNLNTSGVAASWQAGFQSLPGMGWEGQGAGLALACIDNDPRTDWLVMAYDNPGGANSFRYRLLPNQSQAPCPPLPGSKGSTAPQRKSITQLNATELASLRRGFTQMIAWNTAPRGSANYRRSLQYWANMHSFMGGNCSPASGLNNPGMSGLTTHSASNPDEVATWCKCAHGTLQFLTWHRMYLYYFEQVLQQAAGDTSLRLPFFDYETNGQLPLSYREGTMASNPLRVDNRLTALNNGSGSLSSSVTSTAVAMGTSSYSPFNQALEQTPHGSVHCAIGVASCPSGYMGYVPSAGNDPIFYSHHANIDRLYECWLQVAPAARLPNNAAQLNTTFTFIDGSGNTVTRKVADMVTTAQLGYSYAAGGGCPGPGFAAAAITETVAKVQKFQLQGETSLKRGATEVPLRLAPELKRLMPESPAADTPMPRSMLVIDGLVFDEPPRVLYEVYLQRPGGKRALVGVINFFNRFSHPEGHTPDAAADRVVLDATEALRTLGSADDAVLVFEPTTGLSESTVGKAAENISEKANVRFKAVWVEVEK